MSDTVSDPRLPFEEDSSVVQSIKDRVMLDLHEERVSIGKRVHRTVVRAESSTRTDQIPVEVMLDHDRVVVERIVIGREVDAVPPIRTEGDTTILSVVEEEIVVTRRLILTEEVHLRRVKTTERHVETVTVRKQDVVVTRTASDDITIQP